MAGRNDITLGSYRGEQILRYPEHRGLYNRILPLWIETNVRDLLPLKTDTMRLLEKFGSVERLFRWPLQMNVKFGFLEGFYKVKDLWADFDNLSAASAQMYDLVTGTPSDIPPPQRPEIEYLFHRRVFYDYAMYGMRFAFNEWDMRRLGPGDFNRYMDEILAQRIESYGMALNKAFWEHWIGRPGVKPASYRRDDNTSYGPGASDLGSLPFYINGLGFRIGIRSGDSAFPDVGLGNTKNIFAVTYHDGSVSGLKVDLTGPDSIYFSGLPTYWFPDAPGLPIINNTGGTLTTLLDPSNPSFKDNNSLLIHQTVGGMHRGYTLKTYTNTGTNHDNFWGFTTGGVPIAARLSNAPGDSQVNLESPVWDLVSPFYLSPSWRTYNGYDTNRIYDHDYWFRHLAVIRNTKLPTVYSERTVHGSATNYPIYFGDNGVNTLGNPWAHPDYQGGVDTRFTLTPQALERVWQYLTQNGVRGPKILACHPNVAIALNVYAMNNIEWRAMNKSTYGPVEFSAEFPRYRDAVIFTDMMIPDGVVYIITPSEGAVKFYIDEKQFRIEKQPTKNAIHLYGGYFLMRLVMVNAQSHAMIWGVKPN